MIFNPHWFDNSRHDGVAVLEVIAAGENISSFVPLTRTTVEGLITGPLADFTLTHVFRYTKETNPRVIEALYRFPLPGDAAVTRVDVSFGKVTIHSLLKPRNEAETEYENAKKENRAAALVTRESPDVFTLRIAGIAPDEDVVVKTRYVQMGQPKGTGFSFRIPLTTAPRYVRSDERYSRHAAGQPFAILRDPVTGSVSRFLPEEKGPSKARPMQLPFLLKELSLLPEERSCRTGTANSNGHLCRENPILTARCFQRETR